MTYLFTKQGCSACESIKENVDLPSVKGLTVLNLDGGELSGTRYAGLLRVRHFGREASPHTGFRFPGGNTRASEYNKIPERALRLKKRSVYAAMAGEASANPPSNPPLVKGGLGVF